jgi:hypothetical protein
MQLGVSPWSSPASKMLTLTGNGSFAAAVPHMRSVATSKATRLLYTRLSCPRNNSTYGEQFASDPPRNVRALSRSFVEPPECASGKLGCTQSLSTVFYKIVSPPVISIGFALLLTLYVEKRWVRSHKHVLGSSIRLL